MGGVLFVKKVENGFFCKKKVDLSSTQGALCTVSVFFYFTFYLFGGAYAPNASPLPTGLDNRVSSYRVHASETQQLSYAPTPHQCVICVEMLWVSRQPMTGRLATRPSNTTFKMYILHKDSSPRSLPHVHKPIVVLYVYCVQ